MHQVSNRKIGGITLAVVAVFLTGLESGDVWDGQLLTAIAAALKHGPDQIFVFPGETSKQDRDLAAFFSSKRALYRAVDDPQAAVRLQARRWLRAAR